MRGKEQLKFRTDLMKAVEACECDDHTMLFELMAATVSNALFTGEWSEADLERELKELVQVVGEVQLLQKTNPFASADIRPAEA